MRGMLLCLEDLYFRRRETYLTYKDAVMNSTGSRHAGESKTPNMLTLLSKGISKLERAVAILTERSREYEDANEQLSELKKIFYQAGLNVSKEWKLENEISKTDSALVSAAAYESFRDKSPLILTEDTHIPILFNYATSCLRDYFPEKVCSILRKKIEVFGRGNFLS